MDIKTRHIQNPGLFRTQDIFQSLSDMYKAYHAFSESWHTRSSLFKHFQGYLCIFRDADAYSATITSAQLVRREEAFPALLENPDAGKKDPDCVHLWVKFSIQNVVLRVSGRKNSKIFSWGDFFPCILTKCLSKYSPSTKPPLPLPWRISGSALALKNYSFWKTFHFKGLTGLWIRLFLDNWSVICTEI